MNNCLTLKDKHVTPFVWAKTNEVMSAYTEYERLMRTVSNQ